MKKIQSNWIKLVIAGAILIVIYRLTDNLDSTAYSIKNFIGVFAPCIIGAAAAFFLWRPARKAEALIGKCKIHAIAKRKKGLSVLFVYLVIILFIGICVDFIIPGVVKNIKELAVNAPEYIKKAEAFFKENEYLSQYNFIEKLNDKAMGFIKDNLTAAKINKYVTMVGGVANSFMSFFLGIVFSVYILLEGESIKIFVSKVYNRFFSGRTGGVVKTYIYKTIDLFYSYFSALALDALIVGTVTALVLGIFKVPYAVLLGLLVAVGNMVPFFGPIIAAVCVYIITAIAFGPVKAIWVIAFQLVLGQVDGNLIQPKILGKSTGLKPLLVLFSVVVFGDLFGFLGMIMGVPVIAALKMLVDDYLDNGKIDASNG